MPWQCLSVCPSVRPFVHVFRTFFQHALRYQFETLCIHLLLLISMLWHRQAIFKSKGDKSCSSAECRIWNRGPRHQIASRLNARWQTDWAIEDQAKKLELDSPSLWPASIPPAWPHCQLTFAPVDQWLNARWQTDWAIEDQAKKLELDSPSLWSASIPPAWPHCQLTFAPGSGNIHICCC